MTLFMCLHMIFRMRSTPLLVTATGTFVFANAHTPFYWHADLNMAAAAYVFFFNVYEDKLDSPPAHDKPHTRECVHSPMSPRSANSLSVG